MSQVRLCNVITGYGPAGFASYGKHCLSSWYQHWPNNYGMTVYVEHNSGLRQTIDARSMPEWCGFQQRWAHDPCACGTKPVPGVAWKSKYVRAGYNFRYDAVKFSKMALYTGDSAARLCTRHDSAFLVWLDGDVETVKDIPADFVQTLLVDCDCVYLGRRGYHSDTGFVAFRLPQALPLATAWADFYVNDTFLAEQEWHSAYLFDRARERCPEVRCKDIADRDRDYYWQGSPLGPYLVHHKGKRKANLAKPA